MTQPAIPVRNRDGVVLFHMEGDSLRDVNGDVSARRVGTKGHRDAALGRIGATWMSGGSVALRSQPLVTDRRLLDLAPGDVVQSATQVEYGIPDGEEYVADIVSPVTFVRQDRGVWYPENVTDALAAPVPNASGQGTPAIVNPGWSPQSFVTEPYALAAKLPTRVTANADFNLRLRALRHIVHGLRLWRESRIATLLTKASNWATANQTSATAKWNGATGANPLADLYSSRIASAFPVTHIVLSENIEQYFFQNSGSTAVRDFVQAGGRLPTPIIARARSLVSGSNQYIWAPANPANVPLIRIAPDPKTLSTTVTLRWLGMGSPDGELQDGFLVRQFRDEKDGEDWIVVAHNDAEVMPSKVGTGTSACSVGALIVGALQ